MTAPLAARTPLPWRLLAWGIGLVTLLGLGAAWVGVHAGSPSAADDALVAATVIAPDTLVTPGALPEAQALRDFLAGGSGRQLLAGQQESDDWNGGERHEREIAYLRRLTGREPAVRSFDFMFYSEGPAGRRAQTVAERAIAWGQSGGIVQICFHWKTGSERQSFVPRETDFDLEQALIPGTRAHEEFVVEMDLVAVELAKLREARVPVIWRPFHECSGGWFWWGARGAEPFQRAWRFMFERYTQHHGLNHLLWTYNPTEAPGMLERWYPGDDCVDLVGLDVYPKPGARESFAREFAHFRRFTGGRKPLALTENGVLPDPARMAAEGAGWAFFSTWSGDLLLDGRTNPADWVKAVYRHPRVTTRDELPAWAKTPAPPVGEPRSLLFLRPPEALPAGHPEGQTVAVAVVDAAGRTVRAATAEVRLSAVVAGRVLELGRAPVVRGIATFAGVRLEEAAPAVRLVARPGDELAGAGVVLAESPEFAVGPGRGATAEWWPARAPGGAAQPLRRWLQPAERIGEATRTALLVDGFATSAGREDYVVGRVQAWVSPPQTGDYVLWISADDEGELFVTPADTPLRPDATPVARCPGWAPPGDWSRHPEQQSRPLRLKAGRLYHVTALYKEHTGGDHVQVGWRLPDGTVQHPIPAVRLFPQPPAVGALAP